MTTDEILLAFLKSDLLIREARLKVLEKKFPRTEGSWALDDEDAVIAEIKRQIDEIEMGDML